MRNTPLVCALVIASTLQSADLQADEDSIDDLVPVAASEGRQPPPGSYIRALQGLDGGGNPIPMMGVTRDWWTEAYAAWRTEPGMKTELEELRKEKAALGEQVKALEAVKAKAVTETEEMRKARDEAERKAVENAIPDDGPSFVEQPALWAILGLVSGGALVWFARPPVPAVVIQGAP